MTDPSSITSVTEEDVSDESDTTESSYSKPSVSSLVYSSECNTDDKLTTSLVNISISKNSDVSTPTASSIKKRARKYSRESRRQNDQNDSATTSDPFPYGCNPLPFDGKKQKITQAKKRQKSVHSTALTRYVLQKKMGVQTQSSSLPKQEEENFGIDDPNNYLYTDFSDTSSIPRNEEDDDLDSVNDDANSQSDNNENENGNRPILPDMNSNSWFQAKCFDRYWTHYSFVMEWYRQHVQAVNVLSSQCPPWSNTGMWTQTQAAAAIVPKKRSKSKKAKNRARHRRVVKAKRKAAQAERLEEAKESGTTQGSDSDEDKLEMEITDEMLDFFKTSFKHRMERDLGKGNGSGAGECKVQDEEVIKGIEETRQFKIPSLSGPVEQPGVRRTAEMKTLYGFGAPMIHGMETALQMTHDKVLDRHKPKLWPNMPLKVIFA